MTGAVDRVRAGGTEHRLVTLPLFAGLDSRDIACLARGARHRRLEAGQNLWWTNERAGYFAVIEAGIVQIRQMTPAGEGILLGLFRVGEAVGLAAALEGGVFPAGAVAMGAFRLRRSWTV